MVDSTLWIYLVLITGGVVIYHQALYCDFVFDDVSAIKANKDLLPTTPWRNLLINDFWGTPMTMEKSHKSYRPVTVLTFRLNYLFGELEPFGYHLVNILLHCLVTIQFYRFCSIDLSYDSITSFTGALLFLVHPVHTEAVTGVVGRAELLSASCALLAFSLYSTLCRHKYGEMDHHNSLWLYTGVVLMLILATFSKEQGITIAGVCVLYDIFIAQQMTLGDCLSALKTGVFSYIYNHGAMMRRCAIVIISVISILIIRMNVMGGQLPEFTTFDNPASNEPTPTRQLSYNYLLAVNSWLLLCPAQLCCDWTMGTVPLVKSVTDWRNLCTFTFYSAAVLLLKYCLTRRNDLCDKFLMGMLLLILPFLPASNLLFPVGFVVAERVLYIPSMGYCLIVGAIFSLCFQQYQAQRLYKYSLIGAFSLLIIAGTLRTHTRNKDWMSEYSLFTSGLQFTENNAKIWNNVGHALESEGNLTQALHYFTSAARVQPDDIGSHINLGRTLKALERNTEAETALRIALDLLPQVKKGEAYTTRLAPSHLNIFITLGSLISADSTRLHEAEQLYQRAISMRTDFVQAYMNYGEVLLRLKRHEEAIKQYMTALQYDKSNADLHYNLGVVYLDLQQHQRAMNHFNDALHIAPDHKNSLHNTVLMIQESGQASLFPEAEKRLERLFRLDPHNPKQYFTAALLATDMKKFELAEQYFKRSLQLDPEFRKSLFNLALLLANDMNRPLDSIPYIEKNLKLNPQHIKSYLLLGDIAINHMKNLDLAQKSFTEVIRLDPSNVQGRHNLCVVYAERGDLLKSEKCLAEVVQMAPEEVYVKEHLNIIRGKIAAAGTPPLT